MDTYTDTPPPYIEEERTLTKTNTNPSQFRIARKPISTTVAPPSPLKDEYSGSSTRQLRLNLSLDTSSPENITGSELYSSPLQIQTRTTVSTVSTPSTSIPITTPSSPDSSQSTSAYFQNAYKEARHFAGGLVRHPYEYTKHYSILRHSHGLVFYQGSSTTVTVSIFADTPLPAERTIWLQSKGWTGKTGMRMKALVGSNGSWLNVTPSAEVRADQLKPDNERAWQRDIAKFYKKADRHVRGHRLRETAIVRIPAEAGDGYFQLVLCLGEKKKPLCPSPVFRLLSTSVSPHSIRGASLSTLPLELGAMALGAYARTTVGAVIAPVTSNIQSQVQKYMPSWAAREAASVGYSASGASNRVNSTVSGVEGLYDQVRDASYTIVGGEQISLDQGPNAPYPIHFVGHCETQRNDDIEFTIPKIDLTKVSNISQRLQGYYFGWARIVEKAKKTMPEDEDIWHQAVISSLTLDASQLVRARIAEASKRFISVGIICDYVNTPQEGSAIEIQVMGFIRPDEPAQRISLFKGLQAGDESAAEAAMLSDVNDISITKSILDHPAWTIDAIQERDSSQRPGGLERVMTRCITAAQRQIDEMPLHKFGVRMPVDQVRDKIILTNGFYVVR